MKAPSENPGRWRLGLVAMVAVGLVVLLGWWIRTPEVESGDEPVAAERAKRSSDPGTRKRAPAPPAPAPAADPTVQCAVRLPDGPARFVALERFAAAAHQITVSHGLLEAVVDTPDGEGDLVRDGVQVGRLVWGESDGAPWCELREVPVEPLTGRVIDGSGAPVAEAVVTGCGLTTTTDEAGTFVLEVPAHRECRLRAAAFGELPSTSDVVWVVAPGPAELEVRERPHEELATHLASAVQVMESLEQVNEQLRAIAPNEMLDEEIARSRERLPAIREALESDDPDLVLETWLSLQ